jgi:hypothetical protein
MGQELNILKWLVGCSCVAQKPLYFQEDIFNASFGNACLSDFFVFPNRGVCTFLIIPMSATRPIALNLFDLIPIVIFVVEYRT